MKLALKRIREGLVLDFGCGNGRHMGLYSLYGLRCIGIDIQAKMIELARNYEEVVIADGRYLPFKNCFDLIMVRYVLHHMTNPCLGLSEIARCLRVGAFLLLFEVIEDNPLISIGRRVYPWYRDIPVISKFRKKELIGWLRNLGFRIVSQREDTYITWVLEALASTIYKKKVFLRSIIRRVAVALNFLEDFLRRIRFPPGHYYCLAQRLSWSSW